MRCFISLFQSYPYPKDGGCALAVPTFERLAGEATALELHAVGLTSGAKARVVPTACACGASCRIGGVRVLKTTAVDDALTVELY